MAHGEGSVFTGVPVEMTTRSFRLEDIVSILRQSGAVPLNDGFVVNIGAACGLHGYSDPTFGLLYMDTGIGGLLLDAMIKETFFNAYPLDRPGVTLRKPIISSPQSIQKIFGDADVPRELTVLKVDIDSWDLGLLAAMVDEKPVELLTANFTTTLSPNKYRPYVIHMEINTAFPPPIRFSVPLDMSGEEGAEYSREIWRSNSFYYGTSLAAAADVLVPRGYTLLEVDAWDATWVRTDVAHIFQSHIKPTLTMAYDEGFKRYTKILPGCFDRSPKLWVPELATLAEHATAALAIGNTGELSSILKQLKKAVDAEAPRHKETSEPMRSWTSLTGPAGDSAGWGVS